ncbi:MAG: CoA transferase subunit A, partial [Deltaproteobacteria bacterium]|nr:CoA transferase subunit A [Deltaproteobacteria bacterium]
MPGNEGKVMSMAEAVDRFVSDRDQVAIGLSLENLIPFAAGHEIIRQQKKNLTLIGPISDILFDQMIGAGVAERVMAAWVGNVTTGIGYNFRRAVEGGQVTVVDYSNYALSLALQAGAAGLPCALTLSLLGTDILASNPNLKTTTCPFSGQKLVAVKAIKPDVTVVHVQRADQEGNVHLWGPYGVAL